MHFVPFPSLTEAERFSGLLPIDARAITRGPDEAVASSHVEGAQRVRLIQRADGPVYIVSNGSKLGALRASNLLDAAVTSRNVALHIASAYASERGLDGTRAAFVDIADYDQWSVPNSFDAHRPLFRIALNDSAGTELYVSSTTGEVVLDTNRFERTLNYFGSVIHWIYPTVLRSHWAAWDATVWTLSLIALIAAGTGVVVGIARIRVSRKRIRSPFHGWRAWHHVLGLFTATFVLTWSLSGWLSMDHGRLFSLGRLSAVEAATIVDVPEWSILHGKEVSVSPITREIEWFSFDRHFYRRERIGYKSQVISAIDADRNGVPQPYLTAESVAGLVRRLPRDCKPPTVVADMDDYPIFSSVPGAPVYRSICGNVWFHIDGGTGAVLERSDSSRRAYRWVYQALHTANVWFLLSHSSVRTVLIVGLCTFGFLFSLSGVWLGWRRLVRSDLASRSVRTMHT